MTQTGDITYQSGPLALLTLTEFAILIFCGCMPVLPKFFTTITRRLFSGSKRASSMRTGLKASHLAQRFSSRKAPNNRRKHPIDPYDPENQLQSQYEELENHDLSQRDGQHTFSSPSYDAVHFPHRLPGDPEHL